MISLPFEKFMAGKYADNVRSPFTLYMVFKGSECLYIGITTNNPFNRWFNNGYSHCLINIYGELQGQSTIGKMVAESMPGSNKWEIQLWTTKDCIEWLVLNRPEKYKRLKEADIHSLEPIIIQEFKPSENVIFNTRVDGSLNSPQIKKHKRIPFIPPKRKRDHKKIIAFKIKAENYHFLKHMEGSYSEIVDNWIDKMRTQQLRMGD